MVSQVSRAERVLATLEDASPSELWTLSRALSLAGGSFAVLSKPLGHLAVVRETDDGPDGICELSMRLALRRLAMNEEAVERLDDALEPFWQAVRDAVKAAGGSHECGRGN